MRYLSCAVRSIVGAGARAQRSTTVSSTHKGGAHCRQRSNLQPQTTDARHSNALCWEGWGEDAGSSSSSSSPTNDNGRPTGSHRSPYNNRRRLCSESASSSRKGRRRRVP
uniref:Secreted protein n=1 Tax=Plectus sambesii TaxID=2011161 RepID=A0A914UY64_9BILA